MTVRKHPGSPFWHYDFWHKGRRYRGSTKQTSKQRAREVERGIIHDLDQGRDPHYQSPDLDGLISQYLQWLKSHRAKETFEGAARAIRDVRRGMQGVRRVSDITSAKVEKYVERRQRTLATTSLNTYLRTFKAFLRRSVKQGWIPAPPVDIEMLPAPPRGRVVFLTKAEIPGFLKHLDLCYREAAILALNTGLRLNELRFLEWRDVDLERREVWVRAKPELGYSPKGARERVIPLRPEFAEELKARERSEGWVCLNDLGRQLSRTAFQRAIRNARRRAGITKQISPHALRHTYASHLIMAGVDIETVRDLMGHSHIKTTAIYLHTDAKHRREAVAKLRLPGMKSEPERKIIPMRGFSGRDAK